MRTPVVFLIFNRPDLTAQVFARIREQRPAQLWIVADGPRSDRPTDAELCHKSRSLVEDAIDWPCTIMRNYSEINMGCRRRVATGLTWVFDQVQEAIVLEDDCLPHPTFFRFCEDLLDYYRNDERVMMVSGTNQQIHQTLAEKSYFFATTGHIWGWASWRRAWQHYNVDIPVWPRVRKGKWLNNLNSSLSHRKSVKLWTEALEDVYCKRKDTWDWQWNLACWLQRGLSVVPNRNLVTNIGFGPGATHTKEQQSLDNRRPAYEMAFPLIHQSYMAGDAMLGQQPKDDVSRIRALARRIKYKPDGTLRFGRVTH